VVATRLGAYGYPIRSGDELLIADDPEAFASACIRLLEDEAFGAAIAERAWHRFQREWTWDAVGNGLVPVLKRLIEGRSTSEPRR
jgi:glycosyltransferase involved in cell wall biosynthesis